MLGLLDIITVFYGTKLGSIRNKQRPTWGFSKHSLHLFLVLCVIFSFGHHSFPSFAGLMTGEFCLQVLLVLGLMYPLGPHVA